MTMPATSVQPLAAMSIDVEDWFQVENVKGVVTRESWDSRELRVERNTDRMLQILADRKARCTCFILGWVAERCPKLIQRIADAGHEIASHGYGHELVYSIGQERFRQDMERSMKTIEDACGKKVTGYRAPSFSIIDWAIDTLKDLGFEYDSSAFPTVAHDRYGKLAGMDAGEPIVEIRPGFYEMCISVLRLGKKGFPWGGGGYFRLIPYPIFKRGVARILRSGTPYVFYIHPWEIDAGQPKLTGMKRSHAFRHYVNLSRCESRWSSLVRDFQWCTMREMLDDFKKKRVA